MTYFAEVAVGSFIGNTDNDMNIYDYIIPEKYSNIARIGMRAIVPFGGRRLEGYVINIKDNTCVNPSKLRDILDIPDNEPLFDSEQITLAKWLSEEYMCSLTQSLRCIIPSEMVMKENRYVRLLYTSTNLIEKLSQAEMKIVAEINKLGGYIPYSKLVDLAGRHTKDLINKLENEKVLIVESKISQGVNDKTVKAIKLDAEVENYDELISELEQKKNTKVQAELLRLLQKAKDPVLEKDIISKYNFTKSTINTLLKKGMIVRQNIKLNRNPYKCEPQFTYSKPNLTADQKDVIDKILKGFYRDGKREFLVHGVTGSGKTEIYMNLIQHFIEGGKQAIMLVPEISLTPQTIERFKERFKRVAVLHSRLSSGERYDEWKRIKSGEVDIVVGARSAVFAPVNNLGIIVIDEEHEYSYKSDKTPKYQTKEVAGKRCELNNALLVLGSATPAVETYYSSLNGDYSICSIQKRVDNKMMPEIIISDMRQEIAAGNKTIFSRRLYSEIKTVLSRGHQAVLFLNRRGFSTFVSCRQCGHVMKCPRCEVSLTYHMDENTLNCHYCNYTIKSPDICPKCKSKYIKYFGIGTQKVENEVKRLFKDARVLRMDLDTTSRKGAHERIYNTFKNNGADILIGTQMISKGLDFPNVTLVGIIAADLTLNIPDYKACERTFQLITQVSGRAGRGENPGRVIIQTYNPDHYAVVSAVNQDYLEFYNKEILIRKSLGYPPFSDLINIIASSRNEDDAKNAINEVTERIKDVSVRFPESINILGPSPAPLSKINMYYRWQTIIKGSASKELKKCIMDIGFSMSNNKTVNINIDINPVSLA